MSASETIGWRHIHDEVFRRISEREWKPGDQIPKETELAEEFDCARATVSRALRQLADDGFLDRRRKGGTRVALNPARKATLDIPITRLEVETRGAEYSYRLLECRVAPLPTITARRMRLPENTDALHVRTLHLADYEPFMYEDRWINKDLFPDDLFLDFSDVNANEWLIQNAHYTSGDIAFMAENASELEADFLDVNAGAAIFVIQRTTWNGDTSVTSVKLSYGLGFQIETRI